MLLVFTKGIKKGIDFTGGTEALISYKQNIDLKILKSNLEKTGFEDVSVNLQKIDENNINFVSIKFPGGISTKNRDSFEKVWSFDNNQNYGAVQISENVIGPSIGKELTKKAI